MPVTEAKIKVFEAWFGDLFDELFSMRHRQGRFTMTAPVRAAHDLSIPDQRQQAKGYCTSWGWEIVADFVEPGARPPTIAGPNSSS